MSHQKDVNTLVNLMKSVKFQEDNSNTDILLESKLSNAVFVAIAEHLLNNGVAVGRECGHAHWIGKYDKVLGETEIKCSHCHDTKTVNGCYVATTGDCYYPEEEYCPACGFRMDQ